MPRLTLDFTDARYERCGRIFSRQPDGSLTGLRHFQRVTLADGTVYELCAPCWRWRKWIQQARRDWSEPQGFYREASPQIAEQLERAWETGFTEPPTDDSEGD